jgi:hypothetical protein
VSNKVSFAMPYIFKKVSKDQRLPKPEDESNTAFRSLFASTEYLDLQKETR